MSAEVALSNSLLQFAVERHPFLLSDFHAHTSARPADHPDGHPLLPHDPDTTGGIGEQAFARVEGLADLAGDSVATSMEVMKRSFRKGQVIVQIYRWLT